jgi:hypothetical protein
MKQDMLFVPKIVPAQHYCDLNGKMKVKRVVDKSMMNDFYFG